jgi:hypothetical protein
MPTARTKINRQRTLLILLGIALAILLTFNAKFLSSSESHLNPNSNKVIDKVLPTDASAKQAGMILIQDFTKKLSSLSK